MLGQTDLGKSDMAQELVQALNKADNKGLTQKTSYLIHSYYTGLRQLLPLPNPDLREKVLLLWRSEFKRRLQESTLIQGHPQVASRVLALIVTEYRRILRGEFRYREHLAEPMTSREAFNFLLQQYHLIRNRPDTGRQTRELDTIEALYTALCDMKALSEVRDEDVITDEITAPDQPYS